MATWREWIGFQHEIRCQNVLRGLHVEFIGNARRIKEWIANDARKRSGERAADIVTADLELECKFTRKSVYPCHVFNHLFPRFKNLSKRSIALTNDKSKWQKVMDLLEELGIELWDLEDLITYYHPISCGVVREREDARRFVENNSLILPDYDCLVTQESRNESVEQFNEHFSATQSLLLQNPWNESLEKSREEIDIAHSTAKGNRSDSSIPRRGTVHKWPYHDPKFVLYLESGLWCATLFKRNQQFS
jgi:hypothetical protein